MAARFPLGRALARATVLVGATVAVLLMVSAFIAGPGRAATLVRTYIVAPPGIDPNGPSGEPSLGGNGRFVAFASVASNFGPFVGDHRLSHIYLYDFSTHQATLISQGINGSLANRSSVTPSVSADGSVVAFASQANNLVAGTRHHFSEIYVKVGSGPVRLVSVGFGGGEPDADSTQPAVSANGRYVAFTSAADDLVAADSNASSDIFVADLLTGTITRTSVTSRGTQANGPSYNPSISADGHLVSFTSDATNLVSGDQNHTSDVFVHNLASGRTTRVSVSSSGRDQNAGVPLPFTEFSDLSGDGHYVVFDSNATNLNMHATSGHTNVYRHSLDSGHTWLVSESSLLKAGDNDSFAPATSGDGQVTVFESFADNLATPWVPSENIFAQDFASGTALTLDVAPDGSPRSPELDSQLLQQPTVSADGATVAFVSGANNLVPGTNNGTDNLYVRVITAPTTTVVQAPPPVTSDRRPMVEFGGSDALATIGLCKLDGRRLACPVGRPFRLPRLGRGPHVLRVYAADPGTLYDPAGVAVRFTES
jgi:Tol biopolymer transport system component